MRPEAQFNLRQNFSPAVKLKNQVNYVSKIQWWDRGMIHTSIIRQINHKENRVTGPKQVQKLEKQIPLNLRLMSLVHCSALQAL